MAIDNNRHETDDGSDGRDPLPLDRRRFLGLAGVGGAISVGGCVELPEDDGDDGDSVGSVGAELYEREPAEWHRRMGEFVRGLRSPWREDPSEFAEEYPAEMERVAVEILLPGMEEVADSTSVDSLAEVARASAESFAFLMENRDEQQIEQYRGEWCTRAQGEEAREAYRAIAATPATCRLIRPLYTAVLEPVEDADGWSEATREAVLRSAVDVLAVFSLLGASQPSSAVPDEMLRSLNDNLWCYEAALRVWVTVFEHEGLSVDDAGRADEAEDTDSTDGEGEEGDDGEADDEGDEEESGDDDETEPPLSVTLVDAGTGEPIENGTVETVFLEDWWPSKPTGEDGSVSFDIPLEAGDSVGITASAAGYEDATTTIEVGEPPVEHRMELDRAETVDRSVLRVDVVAADTGDPVALAEVVLSRAGRTVNTWYTLGDGVVHFSLENGVEYTVSATDEIGGSGEESITLDDDGELTLEIERDESGDEESSIAVRLTDAETGDPIPDGTVVLYPNRLGHGWGPDPTDGNGVVLFEDLGPFPSFDDSGPDRLEVASLRADAAGYEPTERSLSWHPSHGHLDLSVPLEPDGPPSERSILTVTVVDSDYDEIPSVTVERGGDVVAQERVNRQNRVEFSLKEGDEAGYTVSADGVSEERTVELEGDTEITLEGETSDGEAELAVDGFERIGEGEPGVARVVLRNDGDEAIDLSGWTLSTGFLSLDTVNEPYTFPSGTVLSPGDSYTIDNEYGLFDHAGDEIRVRNADGQTVHSESIGSSTVATHFGIVRVRDGAGDPVDGEPVTVQGDAVGESEHETDENGEVVLAHGPMSAPDGTISREVSVRGRTRSLAIDRGTTTLEFAVAGDPPADEEPEDDDDRDQTAEESEDEEPAEGDGVDDEEDGPVELEAEEDDGDDDVPEGDEPEGPTEDDEQPTETDPEEEDGQETPVEDGNGAGEDDDEEVGENGGEDEEEDEEVGENGGEDGEEDEPDEPEAEPGQEDDPPGGDGSEGDEPEDELDEGNDDSEDDGTVS